MIKKITFMLVFLFLISSASAASISITPNPAYSPDTLSCGVSENPGFYVYKWFNSSGYIKTGQSLEPSYLSARQNFVCKVYLPATAWTDEIYIDEASRTILFCVPNSKRCNGDTIEQCSSDGMNWFVNQTYVPGCSCYGSAYFCKGPVIEDFEEIWDWDKEGAHLDSYSQSGERIFGNYSMILNSSLNAGSPDAWAGKVERIWTPGINWANYNGISIWMKHSITGYSSGPWCDPKIKFNIYYTNGQHTISEANIDSTWNWQNSTYNWQNYYFPFSYSVPVERIAVDFYSSCSGKAPYNLLLDQMTLAKTSEIYCTPDSTRCSGNNIEKCSSDGVSWQIMQACSNGCFKGQCNDLGPVIDDFEHHWWHSEFIDYVDFSSDRAFGSWSMILGSSAKTGSWAGKAYMPYYGFWDPAYNWTNYSGMMLWMKRGTTGRNSGPWYNPKITFTLTHPDNSVTVYYAVISNTDWQAFYLPFADNHLVKKMQIDFFSSESGSTSPYNLYLDQLQLTTNSSVNASNSSAPLIMSMSTGTENAMNMNSMSVSEGTQSDIAENSSAVTVLTPITANNETTNNNETAANEEITNENKNTETKTKSERKIIGTTEAESINKFIEPAFSKSNSEVSYNNTNEEIKAEKIPSNFPYQLVTITLSEILAISLLLGHIFNMKNKK